MDPSDIPVLISPGDLVLIKPHWWSRKTYQAYIDSIFRLVPPVARLNNGETINLNKIVKVLS